MSSRIYCPYEWEDPRNGEILLCMNENRTSRKWFLKTVKFVQHCIVTHFERREVDQIVARLCPEYVSGRYECNICPNSPRDLGSKALYLAHMIRHKKPAEIAFIQDNYIISQTRMDADTDDEELKAIVEQHKKKRRADINKQIPKKKKEVIAAEKSEGMDVVKERKQFKPKKIIAKKLINSEDYDPNYEALGYYDSDVADYEAACLPDDEYETDLDGKSVSSVHTNTSQKTVHFPDQPVNEPALHRMQSMWKGLMRSHKLDPPLMDPVTYCHVAEHPTEEGYSNTLFDAIAEANGLQKLSLKEKEESEK